MRQVESQDNYTGDLLAGSLPAVSLDTGPEVRAVHVVADEGYACAALSNGTIKCWGYGSLLGYGKTDSIGDEPGAARR